MVKKGLSIYTLTKNSAKTLERTLKSVAFADEIVIVDGYSTDDTIKIAKKYTKKIYQRKFEGFDKERNFALGKCAYEWASAADSDEVYTKELQEELKEFVKQEHAEHAFIVPRHENFMGRRIFVSTKTPRVFRVGKITFGRNVHEWPEYEGETGHLKHPLEHYSYENIHHLMEKIQRGSDLEVENIRGLSKAGTVWKMFIEPIKWFVGMLLLKRLIFKGIPGFVFAYYSGVNAFANYAKYYEKTFVKKVAP